MATAIQNVELGIIKFPLISSLASRYPISNQANASASRSDPKGSGSESSKPSMLYAENVLPTSWGYTSVRADTVLMQKDLLGTAVNNEFPDIITEEKLAAPKGKYIWRLLEITGLDLKQYMVLMELEHTIVSYLVEATTYYRTDAKVSFRYYHQGVVPGSFDTWSVPYSYELGTVALHGTTQPLDYAAIRFPYVSVAAPKRESLILISYSVLGSGNNEINGTLFSFTGAINTPAFTFDKDPFVDNYPHINANGINGLNPEECVRTLAVSQGQLITADAYNVYWSSLSDYLNFKPSVTTGAGSGTPTGLQGRIITVESITNGIVVYSTSNMIKGRATGNALYPYQFVEADTASGISHPDDVASGQVHYVNTSEGVVSVTITGDSGVNTELTEFVSSKVFEYWDWSASTLVSERLISSVDILMKAIQDRYLVVSYKRQGDVYYSHALVYDIALKKFGKITYPHLDIATFNFDTEGELRPVSDFGVTVTTSTYHTYSSFPPYQYSSARDGSETPNARNNRIIALLGAAGELCVISPSYNTVSFNSLILLGKFQGFKSQAATMHELTLDGVNFNTKVNMLASYTGNTATDAVQPFISNIPITDTAMGDTATYYGRLTAKTFIAAISGSFHLTYGEAKLEQAGRR